METHRRGSDGRRIDTAEFKQAQIARVVRGEVTLAELARELTVSPSVVRRWQRLSTNGSAAAVSANEEVVPASEFRAALQQIKELERALESIGRSDLLPVRGGKHLEHRRRAQPSWRHAGSVRCSSDR